VRHRQGARVDVGRGLEEGDEGHLHEARDRSIRTLVREGHEALLDRETRGRLPERRELEAGHAPPPRVPAREHRADPAFGELLLVGRSARERAELVEVRLGRGEHVPRELPREVPAEHAVLAPLVAERGRILVERQPTCLKAFVIFVKAARPAGRSPPKKPMKTEKTTPVTRSCGVRRNAKTTSENVAKFVVPVTPESAIFTVRSPRRQRRAPP